MDVLEGACGMGSLTIRTCATICTIDASPLATSGRTFMLELDSSSIVVSVHVIMRVHLVRVAAYTRDVAHKLRLLGYHLTLEVEISSTLDKDRLNVALILVGLAPSGVHRRVENLVNFIEQMTLVDKASLGSC